MAIRPYESRLAIFSPDAISIFCLRYSRYGLEYDDVFQQGALLFIIGVYEHQPEKERSPTAFSSYIKKRLDWGLWMYYRKYLLALDFSKGVN